MLIPADSGLPTVVYLDVPRDEEEDTKFPDVRAVTTYGSFYFEGFHGSLRLYGAPPTVEEEETYVERNSYNHHLFTRMHRLCCTGAYLLVDVEEVSLPEEITVDNVLDLLEFSEEWEEEVIAKLNAPAAKDDSLRFDPSALPDLSTTSQPGLAEKHPTVVFDFLMRTRELIRQAAMVAMIRGDQTVDFLSLTTHHKRLLSFFTSIFSITTSQEYGLAKVGTKALTADQSYRLIALAQACSQHIRSLPQPPAFCVSMLKQVWEIYGDLVDVLTEWHSLLH